MFLLFRYVTFAMICVLRYYKAAMYLQATARGFLVILALSIHDLLEGVALGVARRESSVWFLLLAFASHKWVIAGCLGLTWARSAVCCCLPITF